MPEMQQVGWQPALFSVARIGPLSDWTPPHAYQFNSQLYHCMLSYALHALHCRLSTACISLCIASISHAPLLFLLQMLVARASPRIGSSSRSLG